MKNQKRIGMKALLAVAFAAVMLLGYQVVIAHAASTLTIRDVQIMNTAGNTVCQHVWDSAGQTYYLAWQSADLGGRPSVRMGDIDNDGVREVVASIYYYTRTETIKVGKKTSSVDYYNFRVCVFEDGNTSGQPDWSTGELGELAGTLVNDSWIADVDNNNVPGAIDNELVLIRSKQLEVYHFAGSTGGYDRQVLKTYPAFLFTLDVGDADNLSDNEIVVVPGNSSAVKIWKFDTGSGQWLESPAETVPSDLFGAGMTSCSVTYLRVRNADNVAGNEIIATGNNQRLMVWKYSDGAYHLTSYSQDLNATMAYGIDSGDIDGDSSNEVAINLWGARKSPSRVAVLSWDPVSGSWLVKNTFNSNYIDQRDLRVADLDHDGRAEVVENNGGSPSAGMKVLHFTGTNLLTGTFTLAYSAAGDPYSKLEVR